MDRSTGQIASRRRPARNVLGDKKNRVLTYKKVEEEGEKKMSDTHTHTHRRSLQSESNSVKSVDTQRGGLFPRRVFRECVCVCASDKLSRLLRRRHTAAVGRRVCANFHIKHKTHRSTAIYIYIYI